MITLTTPFFTLMMLAALCYSLSRHSKLNYQLKIKSSRKNTFLNQVRILEYKPDSRQTNANKTYRIFNGLTNKNDEITNSKTPHPIFSDIELALIHSGYMHKSTGEREISWRHANSYIINDETGVSYDTRKIISVMQNKLNTDSYDERRGIASITNKLRALDIGIDALIATGKLPKSFVLSDEHVVYRKLKDVTYGELKQAKVKNNKKQRPRINNLRINFKLN